MKPSLKLKLFLWYFSRFKVPMLGFTKPRLISIDDNTVIIKIALNRRTRNHVSSMYFGALAAGADLAGGLHAVYLGQKLGKKVLPVFKSFEAHFLKRAEQDVYFICDMGAAVNDMLSEAQMTRQRVTKELLIHAVVNYPAQPENVATFKLALSLKL